MSNLLQAFARREQWLLAGMLILITGFAWYGLVQQAGAMHSVMHGSDAGGWDPAAFTFAAGMWATMMLAMMLPAAMPMIFAFARVTGARAAAGRVTVPTMVFVAGYFAVWLGFSVLATVLQWALHEMALLSDAMGKAAPLLGALLLVTAGAFQWTEMKEACLAKCRSPFGFIATEWRDGRWGAWVMGVRHGAFCTGCCWALMLLMFAGGVMNLLWMAGLTALVLAEKIVPGRALSRTTGAISVTAGLMMGAFSLA